MVSCFVKERNREQEMSLIGARMMSVHLRGKSPSNPTLQKGKEVNRKKKKVDIITHIFIRGEQL